MGWGLGWGLGAAAWPCYSVWVGGGGAGSSDHDGCSPHRCPRRCPRPGASRRDGENSGPRSRALSPQEAGKPLFTKNILNTLETSAPTPAPCVLPSVLPGPPCEERAPHRRGGVPTPAPVSAWRGCLSAGSALPAAMGAASCSAGFAAAPAGGQGWVWGGPCPRLCFRAADALSGPGWLPFAPGPGSVGEKDGQRRDLPPTPGDGSASGSGRPPVRQPLRLFRGLPGGGREGVEVGESPPLTTDQLPHPHPRCSFFPLRGVKAVVRPPVGGQEAGAGARLTPGRRLRVRRPHLSQPLSPVQVVVAVGGVIGLGGHAAQGPLQSCGQKEATAGLTHQLR